MLKIPPDWGTFCALIVSFLVFWFIFKRLLFSPFLKLLAERERRLKALRERAERLLHQGEAADKERARQLTVLRHELLTQRETGRQRVEEEVGQMLEGIHLAAKDSVERVRAEIERELQAAEQQLGSLGENLAAELAERVLGRALKGGGPQVHSRN